MRRTKKEAKSEQHTACRSGRKCVKLNENENDSDTRQPLSFAEKETAMVLPSEGSYTTEFRAYNDDAWYSVCVTREVTIEGKQSLRIRYENFSDDQDNVFEPSDFESLEKIQEFGERFRPLSKQIQDDECHVVVPGVRVCACYSFSHDDVRFYDAVVDGVQKSEHSRTTGEESCSCTFILLWLHGPNAENLTATAVENICLVQPASEPDPVVASFLEMLRERIKLTPPHSILTPKEVSGREMVAYYNKGSETTRRLGYFERMQKEKRCARRSGFKACSPEVSVSCLDGRMEDKEFKANRNACMVLMGNLDRELCPSTVVEFLHRYTSVSARVYIFPSLPSEIYTRGAIMLDSEKDFQKLCDFLTNPNYIITSSTGRPWVITEKLVGLKKIKASIGTLLPISKNVSWSGKNRTSNNLKVVSSGNQEFKIASDLRDLFLEFSNHQERLHKKLALLEGRILATRSFGVEGGPISHL